MLANSSDNTAAELKALKEAANTSTNAHWGKRLLMLAINFLPLLHVLCMAVLVLLPFGNLAQRIGAVVVWLYLAPPIFARLIHRFTALSEGRIAPGTQAFFVWWTMFQLQIIFCRFPMLEEALRVVPGLYSQWLRLWGAKVGRLTYWSPGTAITDRSFLLIGDDVVFGAGVRLNAHVLAQNESGQLELILASIKVGDRAVIGGYSLLTAGTEISPEELTRAHLLSPPFTLWQDGKRIRPSKDHPEIE